MWGPLNGGGTGALILGIGLGALGAEFLSGAGMLIVSVGGALHAWGMWQKHRLERADSVREQWWERLLYWLCWALLAALAGYLWVRAGS